MKKNVLRNVLYLMMIFTIILEIINVFAENKNVLAYEDYTQSYYDEDFNLGYEEDYNDEDLNFDYKEDYDSKSSSYSTAEIRRQKKEIAKNIRHVIIFIIISIIYIFLLRGDIYENGIAIKWDKKLKPQVKYNYYRELPRKDATPTEALAIYNKYFNGIEPINIGNVFSAIVLNMEQKEILKFEIDSLDGENDCLKINLKENDVVVDEEERAVYDFLKDVKAEYSEITVKTICEYAERNNTKVLEMFRIFSSTSNEKILGNGIISNSKNISNFFIIKYVFDILLFFILFFVVITETYLILVPFLYMTFFFISFARLVIVSVNSFIKKRNFEIFTQKGLNEYEKWHAFARYMSNFSEFKEDNMELSTLEKYLPYAISLGIGKQVLNQAKIVFPNYNNDNGRFYSNLYAADMFSSEEFQSSIISAYNRGVSSSF